MKPDINDISVLLNADLGFMKQMTYPWHAGSNEYTENLKTVKI